MTSTTIETTAATREAMRDATAKATVSLLRNLADALEVSPPEWVEAEASSYLLRANLAALDALGWTEESLDDVTASLDGLAKRTPESDA